MFIQNKLKNGLNYVLAPLKETEAVTILILIKTGSRYETAGNNGISHFIEHLLFKGTKKRPTSFHLTKELDALGAEYNAFTDKDHTGYYIKVVKEHLASAVEILSDMLYNPLFEQKEIERERGVIIEEINMYDDNPMMLSGDVLEQALFPGLALGRRVIGPKKNIQKISKKQILSYYKKHYFTNGAMVGLAGNFQEGNAVPLLEKYFGNRRLIGKQGKFNCAAAIRNFSLKAIQKDTNQIQLSLALPAYKRNDPRIYPLTVLAVVLGGGMSSRLFMKIREKHGLAYFVRAGVLAYEDTGALVIQAGLDAGRFETALKLFRSELEKIAARGISYRELKTAKEFIKSRLILPLEDSARLISWLLDQMLLSGKIETVDVKLKKIAAVSLSDVKKVALQVINLRHLACGYIGPKEKEQIISKIF